MKTTILIIEDNTDIRESTAEILELSGYAVLQAPDGKAGVEVAQQQLPDLILCDIMMPELDGYGVLYMLSKQPETAIIPFIFLTAKAERIDIRKGMEMGADDFLPKPFDDMELLNAVESRIAKTKHQQEFYSKSLERMENLAGTTEGLAELKETIAGLKIKPVKKGQAIYHEGDLPRGIPLVVSGRFKTTMVSDDGRELITGIFAQEDYLGINAVLLTSAYTETAYALEDSAYCLIPKETIEAFLHKFTDIGKKFIQILSNNVREKEDQLLNMAYNSVRKRTAGMLLHLERQQPSENNNECLKVSREEMASMAGMATETVSRVLSDFAAEKLIEKDGRLIRILNKAKLANEAL